MLMREYIDNRYGEGFWDSIFDAREGKTPDRIGRTQSSLGPAPQTTVASPAAEAMTQDSISQMLADVISISIEIPSLPGTTIRVIPGDDREATYESVCETLLNVLGKISRENGYSSFKDFENAVDNPPRAQPRSTDDR